MPALDLLPLALWDPHTTQNSVPANDNALRVEVLNRAAKSVLSVQPGGPAANDVHILGPAPSGAQWGSLAEHDVVIYKGGTWLAFAPFNGWLKKNLDSGAVLEFVGGEWVPFATPTGGSTIGKHSMYLPAGAMAPSQTGGCAALATVASAANQPDIVTLDFDPTTEEYAQFALVPPKMWNKGTITFKVFWSHAATSTNFGAAWKLQAVAVGDDDPIAVAFGTAVVVTDTGGTTNDVYRTAESAAVTVAGSPGNEEMVFFRLAREPSNGADNMTIDARLHGVMVYWTTDAETDA